ncbi:undecaprenyldiphospho-muramoylpentapeptide beta-N-acetylglucosaminyltransferase [Alteromonas sp. ASW11-36]|uniref:UDP-N-acetylglucosamine--N-acetylmuramyl-(pentapeptide) pyrophosphoryl-undecaprenol N-acetylglucosamine transferase n=1 Tax=Alteromonas arenosi TaxID=3055817 RepID=A0ABT7STM6_9ALTE|nr:undecaprenyldiphospho-muramoylpentapeptide beta-N-acetylglucosaminyltransferase [Alteromonas sp. ASW11-36]MDM7859530.1 undecaprenyldiphospho-muramoylpentapeptide beta-N-acetylglucosaminyltransferase [Alteromonas sp. ASW11-36]
MTNPATTNLKPCILIMAGGTGGHIFPGIAVAECLSEQGWQVEWLGTPDRMEAQIVPKQGYPIHFVQVKGLRGKGLVAKVKAVFALLYAFFAAIKILRQVRPSVVLGMGGYASGPGGVAARVLRIPLLIHEQNAVMGMTNRWLAKLADKVMLGFESATNSLSDTHKVVFTGNPVRNAIATKATQETELGQRSLRILVIGGSLGARPLNQRLPAIFATLNNIEVYHQCGKGNSQTVSEAYQQEASSIQVKVADFIDDMADAYTWADLVVCRAGAITVTEISMAGVAAAFIPLPHAVDDHQTANARSLVDRRAGYLINQTDMENALPVLLNNILSNPQQLEQIRLNALDCAPHDAAQQVANWCKSFVANGQSHVSKGAVL